MCGFVSPFDFLQRNNYITGFFKGLEILDFTYFFSRTATASRHEKCHFHFELKQIVIGAQHRGRGRGR